MVSVRQRATVQIPRKNIRGRGPERSERQIGEIIAADIEGYKLHRRKEVPGTTVNRELALLKRMFSLAIDWNATLTNSPGTHRTASESSRNHSLCRVSRNLRRSPKRAVPRAVCIFRSPP